MIKDRKSEEREQQNSVDEQERRVMFPEKLQRNHQTENTDAQGCLRVADIMIDPIKKSVSKKGVTVHLTGKEFDLLLFLTEQRGRPWKPKELYEQIWRETYLPSSSNTVMVHMLRLRNKIEDDPSTPKIVKTIYGKGYQVD